MRQVSFLFLCSFLIASQSAHCFTVVLKTGKAYEGTFIAETRGTLQFKGRDGIVLSFKKSILDMDAMQQKNVPAEIAKTVLPTAQRKPSLVDLAQANRSNRTGHSKMLNDGDIPGLPEISIVGNFDESFSNPRKCSSELSQADERRWRSEAQALKQRLIAAREKKDKANLQCTRARNNVIHQTRRRKGEVSILQVAPLTDECAQAGEKVESLERLEQEWNDFCERARHAGVPWAWVD